jgi:hypothetical protein
MDMWSYTSAHNTPLGTAITDGNAEFCGGKSCSDDQFAVFVHGVIILGFPQY